jgi:hypothetical protein
MMMKRRRSTDGTHDDLDQQSKQIKFVRNETASVGKRKSSEISNVTKLLKKNQL